MAGNANAINEGKHPEGRRPPIPPPAIPPRQPSQQKRKKRQPKKRMRKSTVQFNGSQPVIRKKLSKNDGNNINIRKHGPKRSSKSSDLAFALRKKSLTNQSPSNSMCNRIHLYGVFVLVPAVPRCGTGIFTQYRATNSNRAMGEGSLFLSPVPRTSTQLQSKATSSPKPPQSPAPSRHSAQKRPKPHPQIQDPQRQASPPKSADQKTNSGNPPKHHPQIQRTQ